MVKIATSERDRESAYKLWSQCFTDSSSYIEYYFSQRFKNENYTLVEREGEILGGMHTNPYSMNFCGDIKKSYYLVAIGTYPQYRGEGVLRELMESFFERCREEKVREVFLLPINPEIYSPYGFAYTHYLENYEISLEKTGGRNHKNLKIHEMKAVEVEKKIERIAEKKLQVLNYINSENQKFRSSLIKSQEEFEAYISELNFEGGHIYWLENSEGKILGTFSYNTQEDNIIVKDIYFENSEVFEKILYFISSFKGYYKNLKIETFIDQNLENYFPNSKEVEIKKIPFIMTKIIDMKSTLELFLKKHNLPDLTLKIHNSYEKKTEYYSWKDGKIIMENKIENNREELEIELDMVSLTSFLYGGIKIETLKKQGKIKIGKEIEQIFSQTSKASISYINEYV